MSGLVTRFASLAIKEDSASNIAKIHSALEIECGTALGDRELLDDLADKYFQDAQEAYNAGYKGICDQYMWAMRWAVAMEQIVYTTFPAIVRKFSEPQSFSGDLLQEGE